MAYLTGNQSVSGLPLFMQPTPVPTPSYPGPQSKTTDNIAPWVSSTNVLGTTTTNTGGGGTTYQSPQPSGDSGGTQPSGPSPEELEAQRLMEEKRNSINQGWDSYINSLNEQLNNDLPNQASNLNQIVENQASMGLNTLGNSLSSGKSALGAERTALETNQDKNLKSLAENLRNMFMSGNVYLGSRGAGDSSAANQYAYALTKLGNKARGDVVGQTTNLMADIGRRETNLTNLYNTEVQNMEKEKQSKVLEVANWLAQQQQAIRSQIGQAGLGRSQDLQGLIDTKLNQAMSYLNTIQQEASSRRQALDQWAISNANSINQIKANLGQMSNVSDIASRRPQVAQFSGQPMLANGMRQTPGYGGSPTSEREKDIFGNYIG